jgi:hypothetical protein
MRKLLVMSILFATFVVPMRAARDRSALRGLRRALVVVSLYAAAYILLIVYVVPRL